MRRQLGTNGFASLGEITAATPHRCRVTLAAGTDSRAAAAIVAAVPGIAELVLVQDGASPAIEVSSTDPSAPGGPERRVLFKAILESLRDAGIGVIGFEPLDLVREAEPLDLVHKPADADVSATFVARTREADYSDRHVTRFIDVEGSPHRRRLEALAGMSMLEQLVEGYHELPSSQKLYVHPYAVLTFAATAAAYNTPGSDGRLLEVAADAWRFARKDLDLVPLLGGWIEGAAERADLSRLAGLPITVTEDRLIPLFSVPFAGADAIRLTRLLPEPLSGAVADALLRVDPYRGRHLAAAAVALRRASPTPEVVAFLRGALVTRDDEAREAVLGTLTSHGVAVDDPPSPTASGPMRLLDYERTTPHRCRIFVADDVDAERAADALRAWPNGVAEALPVMLPDGRWAVDVTGSDPSLPHMGSRSFVSLLWILKRASIPWTELQPLDLVTEATDDELIEAMGDWMSGIEKERGRSRLSRLAGESLLERLVEWHLETVIRGRGEDLRDTRWALLFAVGRVAYNTARSEARLLRLAAEVRRRAGRDERFGYDADAVVNDAGTRAELSVETHQDVALPTELLIPLFDGTGLLGAAAIGLTRFLPQPLPDEVTTAIIAAWKTDEYTALAAVLALFRARPTPAVRAFLDGALEYPKSEVRVHALRLLARNWPDDARPVWRSFLASRSPVDREAAEDAMSEHGAEEDVPDAVRRLGQVIRGRPRYREDPPRGANLVEFLVRFPAHPAAHKALDDVSARWARLDADLRSWLAKHHPELDPANRTDTPVEADPAPGPATEWPLPTMRLRRGVLDLHFDDEAAHSGARDRFEDLVAAHPAITIEESDREAMQVRVDHADPKSLVRQLWAEAGRQAAKEDTA